MKDLIRDGKRVLVLIISLIVIMKIIFREESLGVIARVVLSLFWLYVIPGMAFLEHWRSKLDFLTRLIVGTAAGLAIVSVASYYCGLLGLHTALHLYIIPPAVIAVSFMVLHRRKK
jgi:hypothetical protein